MLFLSRDFCRHMTSHSVLDTRHNSSNKRAFSIWEVCSDIFTMFLLSFLDLTYGFHGQARGSL